MHLRAPSSCCCAKASANHVRRCTLSPQTLPLPAYPNDVRAVDRSIGLADMHYEWIREMRKSQRWSGNVGAELGARADRARAAPAAAEATWPVPGDAHGCLGACELTRGPMVFYFYFFIKLSRKRHVNITWDENIVKGAM